MLRTLVALGLCLSPVVGHAEAPPPQEAPGAARSSEVGDRDDDASPGESGAEGRTLTLNPEGSYGGVVPGGQNLPPRPPKQPGKGGQRVTWTGFQVKGGVPTVFVQTTATPDYHVEARGGHIVVTLRHAKVPVKNNRRPLRVEAFQTDIERIETREHGSDAQVVVSVKGGAKGRPAARVEPSAGGFQLLILEFPARAR